METYLYGRELLWHEVPKEVQIAISAGELLVKTSATYFEKNRKIYCQRCQSEMTNVQANECICKEKCAYCRTCLQMGKVRKCASFYSLEEPNLFKTHSKGLLAWEGELSKAQADAAKDIQKSLVKKETRLLWAVTGAGKTEMLFPGIEQALKNKERVCIASPRIDVCLELAPRIEAAFPTIPYSLLYGDMEEPYDYRQLVIATTHQLYRFKEAFDLLIIDEIDAFPFENDRSLQVAAQKARKKSSTLIYLSATPNRKMQKELASGKIEGTILPARYHRHPLPIPKMKWCRKGSERLLTNFNRTSFGQMFAKKIQAKQKFLIFVPNIKWMLIFEEHLKNLYPDLNFASVSSTDPQRKEKVLAMRAKEYDFLITTTILERGVTFPNIDVLVLNAEDGIFTESALVQIAGRAGRSIDHPSGEVIFFHDGKTLAMKRAIQQIKQMNQLAKKRGLIE